MTMAIDPHALKAHRERKNMTQEKLADLTKKIRKSVGLATIKRIESAKTLYQAMRQRGYRKADLDVVLNAATRIDDDAFLLTDRDAAREIAIRKREIQQLERLRGTKIILEGGSLVTLYHAMPSTPRRRNRKIRRLA